MTKPAEILFVEHRGEDSRGVLLRTANGSHSYVTPPGLTVEHAVWSPGGDRLLVEAGGRLSFVDVATGSARPIAGLAPADEPRGRWFSPDGRRVAVPEGSRLTIVGTAAPVEFALGAGEEILDFLWTPDGNSILLLKLRGSAKGLLTLDGQSGKVLSQTGVSCERLLGWRQGQLVVMRIESGAQVVGGLSAEGEFHRLRTATNGDIEIYREYLPATDRLMISIASEHSGDPTSLLLSEPGLNGGKEWLTGFRHIGEIGFSRDDGWAVFVDQSRPELIGASGGDIYLAETGSEHAELLARAEPGTVTYSSPSIRPR